VSDLDWAVNLAERGPFWRRCVAHGLGLGLVAGALELIGIVQTLQLSMDFGELLVLGLVSVGLGGLLGLIFAAIIGGLMSWKLGEDPDRPTAWCAGLVAASLAAWHLLPMAQVLISDQGRWAAGVCFVLGPIGVAGIVVLNGRYGLRKAAAGAPLRFTLLQMTTGVSMLLIMGAAVAGSNVGGGSIRALTGDTSVVLITVDTLRRDHVSAHVEGLAETPNLKALAARGVVFDNAITPLPETAPAHGALLTGRHPARLGLLSNGHRLARGMPTVQAHLAREGYATGAFVSSFALDSRTGLDQGFQVYDDDFFPGVRGLAEIRLARMGIRGFMRFGDPLQLRPLLERSGDETCDRALKWLENVGDRPFFLWVHLFEPHSPYEPHDGSTALVDHSAILAQEPGYAYTPEEEAALKALYADEVAHTDRVLGDFLDRLKTQVRSGPLAIVFTSDHGEMLGEHGIMFNHHGIWDETIRVPMIIVPPDESHAGTRVQAQVRLMDLSSTILSLAKVGAMEGNESMDLTQYMDQTLDMDLSSLLVGRTGRALDRGTLYGYRAARKGAELRGENLKYIWQPDAGVGQLFDLTADPAELNDLAPTQPMLVATIQKLIQGETEGLGAQTAVLDAETTEALRALGYVE